MKSLRERKFWKILGTLIIAVAVISLVAFGICTRIEKKQLDHRKELFKEAEKAGYPGEYYVCSGPEEITLEGVSYLKYHMHKSAFIGEGYSMDFLVYPDDSYIDESNGNTESLIIYGKDVAYANDPADPVTYYPGKYPIVELYKIAEYKEGIDMWAVAGIMVIVAIIEFILTVILVIYLVIYYVKSRRAEK